MGFVRLHQSSQPEIRDPGFHILVQKYVTRLDVPVNYVRDAIMVKIRYPSRCTNCNPVPGIPIQHNPLQLFFFSPLLWVVQKSIQAPIGHELVDEQVVVRGRVVAMEGDNVSVLDISHCLELPLEGPVPVGAPSAEPLDREGNGLGYGQLVDGSIATGPDHVLVS
ncbi:unnamed protein product [Linum tenue]|uniref:Uncharacterized protein n=1 Tax=Linum tenue TaxID=586396 RepID=A0AAV0JKC5_9ROSI|nr:unnamed protein product [Linum tenue]